MADLIRDEPINTDPDFVLNCRLDDAEGGRVE
jgi:hypothetical protein